MYDIYHLFLLATHTTLYYSIPLSGSVLLVDYGRENGVRKVLFLAEKNEGNFTSCSVKY